MEPRERVQGVTEGYGTTLQGFCSDANGVPCPKYVCLGERGVMQRYGGRNERSGPAGHGSCRDEGEGAAGLVPNPQPGGTQWNKGIASAPLFVSVKHKIQRWWCNGLAQRLADAD